ncbi:DNA alkylation repair protein, partial [bacterium]|nr:DNA alkylation repair protein [bacterium]
ADPVVRKSAQRFFKEGISCYGVKTAAVYRIAGLHWKRVKDLPKKSIYGLCGELFASGIQEEAGVVCDWVPRLADSFERGDLRIFKKWIGNHVDNWAKCDMFCNHTLGDFIDRFPDSASEIRSWSGSKNRWMKRAAAVAFILPCRRGNYLKEALETADALLEDPDDMVQKGYGWLLKEASRLHRSEVLDFVMKRRDRMPRTALRYAIELMPPGMRKKAMQKDAAPARPKRRV